MPTLATIIGLNESIILQQVHYWLKIKEKSKQDYIDGHFWVYNTYEQWQEQFPFFSIRTLRRTFTSLEKMGLLLTGNYNKVKFDQTKWYTIDYGTYENIISSYGQIGHTIRSNWTIGKGQNDQTYTIDYTETTTKTTDILNGATPKRSAVFDWSILEKQIINSCNKVAADDPQPYIDIIEYYYQSYINTFHEEHPRLSKKSMDSVVSAIQCGTDLMRDDRLDVDMYRDMIDKHFQTQYQNCDYSICHFMTEGICNNRFHESCY